MVKKLSLVIVFILLLATFSSCQEASEIDDISHVLVIGIDKGVSDKWRITLQFPNMKDISAGGQGGMGDQGQDSASQEGYSYVTVDAPSFFTGLDMLSSSLSRRLTFTHTDLIVISEELARDGLLGDYIVPIRRFAEIRWTTHLAVTKGSALDFIRANDPFIGTTLSKSLQSAVTESLNTGYFPHTTLNDFYESLLSTNRQPIMMMAAVNQGENFDEEGDKWGKEYKTGGDYAPGQLPRLGDNKIEYWGTGIFNQHTMVDILDGTETRTLLMIRGDFSRGFFTLQDPKEPELIIVLDVRQDKKPKVKVSFEEGKPTIDLSLSLNADILSIQSRLNYEEDPLLSQLEDTFKRDLKEEVNKLIEKCKDLNTDVFKFGDVATRQFLTISDWEEYDWNDHFSNVEVNTEIDFFIKRTGTQFKSSPITDPEEGDKSK